MSNREFKNKVLGIINSGRSGPEKVGIISSNPLIVNYKETVKDLKEMRAFLDIDVFNRVIRKIQQELDIRKRSDVSERLLEDLND